MAHFNILLLLLLLLLPPPSQLQPPVAEASPLVAGNDRIDVIVIGDSTAADYSHYPAKYPLAGWAMFLQRHFYHNATTTAVVVRDLAFGGTSSKSYYEQHFWQQAKSRYLSAADYVFIEFGHNDQTALEPARHTDPFTSYKHYLSLFINDTRAAMATPVLLTSISRAIWHINGGSFKQTLGDYPVAMRQLAQELQVPLIDLNKATEALFTKLGENATQRNYFMCLPPGKFPNYPSGIHDATHLQVQGAQLIAQLVAEGINTANLPLKAYLFNSTRVQ